MSNPTLVTDRPLADKGLLSYRCQGAFGWIMIGATDDEDAMVQARRSSAHAQREHLQKWDGAAYVPCVMPKPAQSQDMATVDQAGQSEDEFAQDLNCQSDSEGVTGS